MPMTSSPDGSARPRPRNRMRLSRRARAGLVILLALATGIAGGTALGYQLAGLSGSLNAVPPPDLIRGRGPGPSWGLTSTDSWDSDGTSLVVLSRPDECPGRTGCTGHVTLYDLDGSRPARRWHTKVHGFLQSVQLWAGKVFVGDQLLSVEDGSAADAPWPSGELPTFFEDARTALACEVHGACTAWAPDGSVRWELPEGLDSQCASGTLLAGTERHMVLCESQNPLGEATALDLDSGTTAPLDSSSTADLDSLVVLPATDGWLTVPVGFQTSGGQARLWSTDGADQGAVDTAAALELIHNRQPLSRTPPTLAQYRAAVEQGDTSWAEVVMTADDDCTLAVDKAGGRQEVVAPSEVCALQSDRPAYLETGHLSADGTRVLFHSEDGDRGTPAVLDLASMQFVAMPPEATGSETKANASLLSGELLVVLSREDRVLRGYDLA